MASSPEAVKEILEKKSADYAGRPQTYSMFTATLGTLGLERFQSIWARLHKQSNSEWEFPLFSVLVTQRRKQNTMRKHNDRAKKISGKRENSCRNSLLSFLSCFMHTGTDSHMMFQEEEEEEEEEAQGLSNWSYIKSPPLPSPSLFGHEVHKQLSRVKRENVAYISQ